MWKVSNELTVFSVISKYLQGSLRLLLRYFFHLWVHEICDRVKCDRSCFKSKEYAIFKNTERHMTLRHFKTNYTSLKPQIFQEDYMLNNSGWKKSGLLPSSLRAGLADEGDHKSKSKEHSICPRNWTLFCEILFCGGFCGGTRKKCCCFLTVWLESWNH